MPLANLLYSFDKWKGEVYEYVPADQKHIITQGLLISNEIFNLTTKSLNDEADLRFVDIPKVERNSKEYNRYRERVLKRDGVCQCCGSKEELVVHHPMPFNQYNSLGADTNNGIVLCKECHTEYHHQNGYGSNCNPITLAQFFRDYAKPFQTELSEFNEENKQNLIREYAEFESFIKASKHRYSIMSYLEYDQDAYTPTQISEETGANLSQTSLYLSELKNEGLITCLNEHSHKGKLYVRTSLGEDVMNYIEGGVSYHFVRDNIEYLQEDLAGECPLNVLCSDLQEKYGFSEKYTETGVTYLVQKGMIYQPSVGYFKVI